MGTPYDTQQLCPACSRFTPKNSESRYCPSCNGIFQVLWPFALSIAFPAPGAPLPSEQVTEAIREIRILMAKSKIPDEEDAGKERLPMK